MNLHYFFPRSLRYIQNNNTIRDRSLCFFLFEDVQIFVKPERDCVQRQAEERGASRQEVRQEEVGEDRVHRQSRLGEKIFNHLGHYGFVIMANF